MDKVIIMRGWLLGVFQTIEMPYLDISSRLSGYDILGKNGESDV